MIRNLREGYLRVSISHLLCFSGWFHEGLRQLAQEAHRLRREAAPDLADEQSRGSTRGTTRNPVCGVTCGSSRPGYAVCSCYARVAYQDQSLSLSLSQVERRET